MFRRGRPHLEPLRVAGEASPGLRWWLGRPVVGAPSASHKSNPVGLTAEGKGDETRAAMRFGSFLGPSLFATLPFVACSASGGADTPGFETGGIDASAATTPEAKPGENGKKGEGPGTFEPGTSDSGSSAAADATSPPPPVFEERDAAPVDPGCAAVKFKAQLSPAALLVVLDGSGTMAQGNKYGAAQVAIVNALDEDAFDGMVLGLSIYPTGTMQGPSCVFGFPVTCRVNALLQVPLASSGTDKSNAASGVRSRIYTQLANSAPNQTGVGDGNPSYAALQKAYEALRAYSINGRRIVLYITDGGASCTSLASPARPAYPDGNGCNDWEKPENMVSLIQGAYGDPQAPVHTFVVGVPGADTYDPTGRNNPPYRVRHALSAYAYAGSPTTVDPQCDGRVYSQTGPDPQVSCHFDMTQNNYSSQALASAIQDIRGKLLGCVYELPTPEAGVVDRDKVNIEIATSGSAPAVGVKRRKNPADDCALDGCWDYDAQGKVELIGKACVDVKGSAGARVSIAVGCQTILK